MLWPDSGDHVCNQEICIFYPSKHKPEIGGGGGGGGVKPFPVHSVLFVARSIQSIQSTGTVLL